MILHGDCLDVLKTLDAESIDACVTDPPYGLEFMGKEWDKLGSTIESQSDTKGWTNSSGLFVDGAAGPFAGSGSRVRYGRSARSAQKWHEDWAREVYRVLKPGAHVLACGGTRTYHRLACAIEDAGFEIRDCLAWLYGSGFPKSLNLGEGLGTALKPAYEPIVLARKPFTGTVKGNVEQHGTGALRIDDCRIGTDGGTAGCDAGPSNGIYGDGLNGSFGVPVPGLGRWPANVVIDEIAALVIDEQSGELTGGFMSEGSSRKPDGDSRTSYGSFNGTETLRPTYADTGGASRFYYCAKPSREERDMGCYGLPLVSPNTVTGRVDGSAGSKHGRAGMTGRARGNFHPTVKPIELMRWLIRLVTPPNGIVLDPFLGSGTTGIAARYEQRQFIGIEREAAYVEIAERRIAAAAPLFAEVQPEVEPAADEAQGDLLAF